MSTESDNKRYREALEQYKADRERIASIMERMKYVQIGNDDIEWLCQIAKDGINNKESSWYDHG
jgi:hypothetical protein